MKHGRLIDADALIEAYDRAHEGEPGKARQLILDAPTIEERKPGKWIVIDDQYELDTCKCSECGVVEYFNQGWKRFDYCPNCGAKMEGLNNARTVNNL
jgi:hypothetical protein